VKTRFASLLAALGVTFLSAAGFASELKPGDQVVFFPTLARAVQDRWELQIHGWVFEPENHHKTANFMGRLLGIHAKELTAEEENTFHERFRFFLEDNERRRILTILLGGQTFKLNPSAPNGHFSSTVRISPDLAQKLRNGTGPTNRDLTLEMIAAGRPVPAPYSAIQFLEETGISVVSDIDDTIKISEVPNQKELLRNTFCRPFRPVPGMAKLYQQWQVDGAQFHYISAMPWQLYLPMREFMSSNGFPSGVWECRFFRFKDMSFFNLLRSPSKYKQQTIQKLVRDFPKRRFVLVGDSGEDDPEVYAAMARKFPQQITHILIRDVTGEAPDSERYRKTFATVAPDKWKIFKEAKEISRDLN